MPRLTDVRHERFCLELAELYFEVPPRPQPQLEAYRRAGFKPHRGNCYRLERRPEVAARLQELLAEQREFLDMRLVTALVRVNRIAMATVPAYYEKIGEALRTRDITELPPQLADAIAEIELDDDGRIRRLKLHDKMQALNVILKHFGAIPEETPKTEVNIFNALSVEDQRALADALEAISRGETPAIEGAAAPVGGGSEAP